MDGNRDFKYSRQLDRSKLWPIGNKPPLKRLGQGQETLFKFWDPNWYLSNCWS